MVTFENVTDHPLPPLCNDTWSIIIDFVLYPNIRAVCRQFRDWYDCSPNIHVPHKQFAVNKTPAQSHMCKRISIISMELYGPHLRYPRVGNFTSTLYKMCDQCNLPAVSYLAQYYGICFDSFIVYAMKIIFYNHNHKHSKNFVAYLRDYENVTVSNDVKFLLDKSFIHEWCRTPRRLKIYGGHKIIIDNFIEIVSKSLTIHNSLERLSKVTHQLGSKGVLAIKQSLRARNLHV